MEELKPCPFCSGENIEYKYEKFAVVCNNCEAEGSFAEDEQQAIEAWNKRATGTCGECEGKDIARYLDIVDNSLWYFLQ